MLRQVSSRNQRNKGCRLKHFLQICLLVAISIWLIYQLKHSYDKKRSLEARGSKIYDKVAEIQSDFFKLGRKDLEETASLKVIPKNEDEEVDQEEEQETKQETEAEEGRGGGGDEIDESDVQDQETGDEESDHGEEPVDEEEKLFQAEGAELLDGGEHEEREGDSQGAREENYKGDDASSAVLHDSNEEQMEKTEKKDAEKENMTDELVDGSKENSEMDVGGLEGSNFNASAAVLGENETNDNPSINGTSVEQKEPELEAANSEVQPTSMSNSTSLELDSQNKLQINSTASTEIELQANSTSIAGNEMETQNNSTEAVAVADDMDLQNGNASTVGLDSVQDRNDTTADPGARGEDEPKLLDGETEQSANSNTVAGGDASVHGESDDSSQSVLVDDREVNTGLSSLSSTQNEAGNDEVIAAE